MLSETGLNLAPDSRELDPIPGCVADSRITCPPREAQYLAEVYSPAVSVMERSTASVGVRLSIRLTSSGRCVYWGASGSDLHPRGGDRKNESECAKEVENGSDCERSLRKDAPSRRMLRSKEGKGNLASANERVSVRLNASESGVLELGNESVTD